MATVYSLVCENGSAGTYWGNLSASDRLRYGSPGGERVYGGLIAWQTARSAATSSLDAEICELGDAFTETVNIATDAVKFSNFSSGYVEITSQINGAFTDAFHGGLLNSGYIIRNTQSYCRTIRVDRGDSRICGFISLAADYEVDCFSIASAGVVLEKLIADGGVDNTGSGTNGFYLYGGAHRAFDCLAVNCTRYGFDLASYEGEYALLAHCFAGNNGTGWNSGASSAKWKVANCGAFGNTTNWGLPPSSTPFMSHNIGESGDSPWDTDTSAIATLTSAHFINAALSDFRPVAGSPIIDAGFKVYGHPVIDLVGNPRPSYTPGLHPDDLIDIGPYEFDHGNGLAPESVLVSITGMIEASELAIYKTSDGSVIVSPTTIGASGEHSLTYSYTGDTAITIVVRKGTSGTKYLPYRAPGLITSAGFGLIVNQVEDTIAT